MKNSVFEKLISLIYLHLKFVTAIKIMITIMYRVSQKRG